MCAYKLIVVVIVFTSLGSCAKKLDINRLVSVLRTELRQLKSEVDSLRYKNGIMNQKLQMCSLHMSDVQGELRKQKATVEHQRQDIEKLKLISTKHENAITALQLDIQKQDIKNKRNESTWNQLEQKAVEYNGNGDLEMPMFNVVDKVIENSEWVENDQELHFSPYKPKR